MSSLVSNNVFVADIYVSDNLNREMVKVSSDLSKRCIYVLGEKFNFDAEEAIRMLGLENIKVERKSSSKGKKEKAVKFEVVKAAFPMPFNGEFNESLCYALRQNNGLYTQCTGARRGEGKFCKGCAGQMAKSGAEIPEYGTIQQRMSAGIFEYVDPKGRKPIAYTKVMKKYKLTKEMVLEEAGKLNVNINLDHFVAPEESVKRGRPAKEEKEVKSKGVKGRPKKTKKVIEIDGDEEDLFASLVKTANMDESEVTEEAPKPKAKKASKSEEEKEAERLAKEAEKKAKEDQRLKEKAEKEAKLAADKAEKEAKLAADKAEKEAKLAAEKAEKEAKKEAERLAKEAKKKADEDEKVAKKAAAEEAKKAKDEAKKAKETKKTSKPAKKAVVEDDEEPDVVKKIEFEGKKYLKSKKTGIVYDYDEYTKNGEQVVIGKWNETTNKLDLNSAEEEEEEYDE
jgi:chemotaxis protein histidine kinase CheA